MFARMEAPQIGHTGGRWLIVKDNNLHFIGILKDDLVCVVPAMYWPEKGTVLMRDQDNEERICYAEITDHGKCVRINTGGGTWWHFPIDATIPRLLGWIVQKVTYYPEPEPTALRLIHNQCEETLLVHAASQSIRAGISTLESFTTTNGASGENTANGHGLKRMLKSS